MNLLQAYRTFRSPKFFLWVLCLFCGAWATWNLTPRLPHFDDSGFERLTLILSIEASIASAVMLAVQERQDHENARRDGYMQHMLETVLASSAVLVEQVALVEQRDLEISRILKALANGENQEADLLARADPAAACADTAKT